MIEIKFRAWIGELKCFTDEIEIYHDETYNAGIKTEKGIISGYGGKNEDFLEQYIGLKDKNSKEIFEGDLIKHNANIYLIKWNIKQLCFICIDIYNKKNYRFGDWLLRVVKYIKIIGNIHENPELLKE
jgi:uncharacterized phage protein (TIGR01671 family)